MIKSTMIAAAVFAGAVALTTAASAQQPTQYRGQLYGAETQRYSGYQDRGYQNRGYQDRDWRESNAFWPGQVAAGVVGGAIGAAGAIATAPFEAGYQGNYDMRSYAERNGFVCLPGTTFRGEDGRMHLCQ
ncbi:hypothetical protein [Rhodopseudomonas palustris]|uniref:Lectin-like protein BA14k n=1 Tax=Rhodopseudomonas palustris (strain ATCC BAA-98 / CGA009) TaxID=258594 RepID=Q6N6N5_RHOPA|nr:hypothetical protein [Rhodopseudomonas palustris]OPF90184.1 hypothetical protein B1S06_22545 [Rhodopseudomonas palustris]PPQ42232.1 hypothetical protein CKO39_18805 [Rhodopseudomonas palustris]QQM04100.1 hypothetical protein I8G32_02651 [Rhodopseudomonas palustris]RJF62151.1 hypothetical protein D4Q71_20805 [Rhodopseudomonas palustris]WAB75494.1 hypothetical protein OR798_13350 [Rhodopseudomonas palustris]